MDPSNGGLSLSPLPGDVRAQSGRRWPRPREPQFSSYVWKFQVGLCLYVTAAVKGGSPRASRTWSQRPKLAQGSLEPVPFLGAHTAYTCKRGEVSLGLSNEVRLHRFSSPPFGSLFILFPLLHTFGFLFSFMSSCLHVWSSQPFLRLRARWSRP